MRYLFFDIECADGNKAICEYGYVLTDTSFNIIQEHLIMMNPESNFKLTGRKGQKDLVLGHSEEEYRKCKKFTDFYDNIKFLMTQDDLIIFAHGATNDINFLYKNCRRYHLDPINYVCYDTQKIINKILSNYKNQMSLADASSLFLDEKEEKDLTLHDACKDALRTMLIIKSILEKLEFSMKDLLELVPESKISTIEYINSLKEKQKLKNEERKEYKKFRDSNSLFNVFYDEYKENKQDENLPKVALSLKVQVDDKLVKEVINSIKTNQFVPSKSINDSDYLVVKDNKNIEFLLKQFKKPYKGKIVLVEDFIKGLF